MAEFSPGFLDLLANSRYAVIAEAAQFVGAANLTPALPAGLKEKANISIHALSCNVFTIENCRHSFKDITNIFFLTASTGDILALCLLRVIHQTVSKHERHFERAQIFKRITRSQQSPTRLRRSSTKSGDTATETTKWPKSLQSIRKSLPHSEGAILDTLPEASSLYFPESDDPVLYLGLRKDASDNYNRIFALLDGDSKIADPSIHFRERALSGTDKDELQKSRLRSCYSMLTRAKDLDKPFCFMQFETDVPSKRQNIKSMLSAVILYYMAAKGVSQAAFQWQSFRKYLELALQQIAEDPLYYRWINGQKIGGRKLNEIARLVDMSPEDELQEVLVDAEST